MHSKTFGKLGWPVSAVGLGTWNIGNQWGVIDEATAWATIRSAYDAKSGRCDPRLRHFDQ